MLVGAGHQHASNQPDDASAQVDRIDSQAMQHMELRTMDRGHLVAVPTLAMMAQSANAALPILTRRRASRLALSALL